jgi:tetratricopeptide (TPR) repeat protein
MSEPLQPLTSVAEDLERLGDQALIAGDLDEALEYYLTVTALGLADHEVPTRITDLLGRVAVKINDVRFRLQSPGVRAAELRTAADQATDSGSLAHAAHLRVQLGEALEEMGDSEDAESAYRQAVVLARKVDADDPELMLYAFKALTSFLGPTAESIALASEMGSNLVVRDEMYHPMRAAEAACHWAEMELWFAEEAPHRIDHVLSGVVEPAVDMLDDVCDHGRAQDLRRQAAAVLRIAGRDAEAGPWQEAADEYENWECFSDQQIPGHVHLWDIRVGPFAGADEDEP